MFTSSWLWSNRAWKVSLRGVPRLGYLRYCISNTTPPTPTAHSLALGTSVSPFSPESQNPWGKGKGRGGRQPLVMVDKCSEETCSVPTWVTIHPVPPWNYCTCVSELNRDLQAWQRFLRRKFRAVLHRVMIGQCNQDPQSMPPVLRRNLFTVLNMLGRKTIIEDSMYVWSSHPLLATFLSVLFWLLSLLISDFRFGLVWFRLSCDHGWIRSGSVNVR